MRGLVRTACCLLIFFTLLTSTADARILNCEQEAIQTFQHIQVTLRHRQHSENIHDIIKTLSPMVTAYLNSRTAEENAWQTLYSNQQEMLAFFMRHYTDPASSFLNFLGHLRQIERTMQRRSGTCIRKSWIAPQTMEQLFSTLQNRPKFYGTPTHVIAAEGIPKDAITALIAADRAIEFAGLQRLRAQQSLHTAVQKALKLLAGLEPVKIRLASQCPPTDTGQAKQYLQTLNSVMSAATPHNESIYTYVAACFLAVNDVSRLYPENITALKDTMQRHLQDLNTPDIQAWLRKREKQEKIKQQLQIMSQYLADNPENGAMQAEITQLRYTLRQQENILQQRKPPSFQRYEEQQRRTVLLNDLLDNFGFWQTRNTSSAPIPGDLSILSAQLPTNRLDTIRLFYARIPAYQNSLNLLLQGISDTLHTRLQAATQTLGAAMCSYREAAAADFKTLNIPCLPGKMQASVENIKKNIK